MRVVRSAVLPLLALAAGAANAQDEAETMSDSRTQEAIALMTGFAERTGLASGLPPRRYLWTDAFAVCNFLGLARETGDEQYQALALRLVDQVHHTLGRHRQDDPRTGWISGLAAREAEAHPTRGGLRIGKAMPERMADEPFDERLEWDRDGQYYHYLTRWMHALDRVARVMRQPRFNLWARELAASAHAAFTYSASGAGRQYRMYWKMSIDLARPLVPSMGQHDPLDGYITYLGLRAAGPVPDEATGGPHLGMEIEQLAAMVDAGDFTTPDPLGVGGLLVNAYLLRELMRQGAPAKASLLETLLTAALAGLRHYARSDDLQQPSADRLAFRELGLAIGLHALTEMARLEKECPDHPAASAGTRALIRALMDYMPLREVIESWWRDPLHRENETWVGHRDINEVMLATSLKPEGFLGLD
jgi:hypothetical protein